MYGVTGRIISFCGEQAYPTDDGPVTFFIADGMLLVLSSSVTWLVVSDWS